MLSWRICEQRDGNVNVTMVFQNGGAIIEPTKFKKINTKQHNRNIQRLQDYKDTQKTCDKIQTRSQARNQDKNSEDKESEGIEQSRGACGDSSAPLTHELDLSHTSIQADTDHSDAQTPPHTPQHLDNTHIDTDISPIEHHVYDTHVDLPQLQSLCDSNSDQIAKSVDDQTLLHDTISTPVSNNDECGPNLNSVLPQSTSNEQENCKKSDCIVQSTEDRCATNLNTPPIHIQTTSSTKSNTFDCYYLRSRPDINHVRTTLFRVMKYRCLRCDIVICKNCMQYHCDRPLQQDRPCGFESLL